MSIESLYVGSDSFECPPDLNIHPFFLNNGVTSWTVEAFLSQYPSDVDFYTRSLRSIKSHRSTPRSIRSFCFKKLKFLESFEGSAHVRLIQAQARTSQNNRLIRENCLDGLQRDIIKEQETKLRISRINTFQPSTEPLTAELPSHQAAGNSDQSKADDSSVETSSSTPTAVKRRKKHLHITEEPWRSLTISLMDMVNGKKGVMFPSRLPDMLPEHGLLFDHAVESLKEYQNQEVQDKDTILLKDAQVAMSCVLNTMSKRACQHFEDQHEESLVKTARSLSVIQGFEEHACTAITQRYSSILAEKGLDYLRKKLIVDRGAIYTEYLDRGRLPADVEMEDKVLQILLLLCQFILRPPFGDAAPSENDCLQLWTSIFSLMAKNVTIHTGEKALEASKIMRQWQAAELDEMGDSGRKIDCIFMYGGLEISSIEFKRPGCTKREFALQNRENIMLARCIQEAHVALGAEDVSIMMADVAGFVGVFYQVKLMGDIAIAGETTSTMVHLPRSVGGLKSFLKDSSLAIMWNFMTYLERQGQKVLEAKECHDVKMEKAILARAVAAPSNAPPPSKKRTWTGRAKVHTSTD